MCILDKKFANYLKDKNSYLDLIKMLSVFCPHICEEIWKDMKQKSFVSVAKWPIADKKKINKKFEEQDQIADKLSSDINNILKIIGKKVSKAFVYVLPKELELFKDASISVQKSVPVEVQIFAVNDKKKYDPENKNAITVITGICPRKWGA